MSIQRHATVRRYILYFTADLLYMFRVPFTPIIKSTGNCSRPLVQALCRDRLDGVAINPLKLRDVLLKDRGT
jgi:hypothetical protein